MLITDIALITANFIMRKVLDIITIVTGVLMLGILGGGFFTFKYVTSEQFKNKMLNEVMGSVNKLMPKMLDSKIPKMTSPHVPIPYTIDKGLGG